MHLAIWVTVAEDGGVGWKLCAYARSSPFGSPGEPYGHIAHALVRYSALAVAPDLAPALTPAISLTLAPAIALAAALALAPILVPAPAMARALAVAVVFEPILLLHLNEIRSQPRP